MRTGRQRIALFALLTVLWAALWPLISSAHAFLAAEPVMLCHQAGMQVAPDEAPSAPADPADHGSARVHCPLCIMAFYVSHAAPPEVPAPQFWTRVAPRDAHFTVLFARFEAPLPPSRAPPSALPA